MRVLDGTIGRRPTRRRTSRAPADRTAFPPRRELGCRHARRRLRDPRIPTAALVIAPTIRRNIVIANRVNRSGPSSNTCQALSGPTKIKPAAESGHTTDRTRRTLVHCFTRSRTTGSSERGRRSAPAATVRQGRTGFRPRSGRGRARAGGSRTVSPHRRSCGSRSERSHYTVRDHRRKADQDACGMDAQRWSADRARRPEERRWPPGGYCRGYLPCRRDRAGS